MTKKRVSEIINRATIKDIPSLIYDLVIVLCVIIGIIPLILKNVPAHYEQLEIFIVIIYSIDLILRIWTRKENKLTNNKLMLFIDFASIIVTLVSYKVLKLIRIIQLFKLVRYSDSLQLIVKVLNKSKKALASVFIIAGTYIIASAIILFNVEPNLFNNFIDALWFSSITLLSIGYGDIVCVTYLGKFIVMCGSLVGVAIVALPTSILTAQFVLEMHVDKVKKIKNSESK